jgi:hypothetical protein
VANIELLFFAVDFSQRLTIKEIIRAQYNVAKAIFLFINSPSAEADGKG